MSSLEIRLLDVHDAAAYRELRLGALREFPESFGSSYEEESEQPLKRTIDNFTSRYNERNFIAGAFLDGALVGMIGFFQHERLKMKHKGYIWGMYVKPDVQGNRLGQRLMEYALERAKQLDGLEVIQLSVVTSNERAYRLYEKLGFVSYGVEKHALRVNGQEYDEHHMYLVVN